MSRRSALVIVRVSSSPACSSGGFDGNRAVRQGRPSRRFAHHGGVRPCGCCHGTVSLNLSVYMPTCMCVSLSVCLSVRPSVRLSVCLSVRPSVCPCFIHYYIKYNCFQDKEGGFVVRESSQKGVYTVSVYTKTLR